MKDVIPEVYLETRRKKKNGSYPVKLRIIYNRQTKYYPVNVDLTIEQFELITQSKRPPVRLVKEYTRIYKEQGRALEIISSMKAFDFYSFEKKFTSRSYGSNSVKQYFKDRIVSLLAEDRVGTADSYEQTLNSLLKYQIEKYKRDDIKFQEVNISWLQSYERFMIQKEFSYATIGVYLRTLRAIYNLAIQQDEVQQEQYPFGKGKYQIPATSKRKKALSNDELKTLCTSKVGNIYQEKARDFWLFSFYCNGMNVFDIARLKWSDIEDDKVYFVRTKTKNTTKTNQTEIVVHLNEFIKLIIDKYGRKSNSPYVFDIICPGMKESEIKVKVKTFTRFINQHIKKLAEDIGINNNISSVWARHSFATSVIALGNSLEFVQESLGHQNIKTTMSYWAGFDHDHKKKVSESLLNITK